MNAQRRKELSRLLEALQAVKSDLEAIRDKEQDYYDNMPESLQNGTKGENVVAIIDSLESAANSLEDAESNLADAQSAET